MFEKSNKIGDNKLTCRGSSGVEQYFRKVEVVSSNLTSGS